VVLWWHRNPSRKGWSINVLMENGNNFYPDFIVGIKQRKTQDGGLLADTKYAYETTKELPKLLAEHASYGRVLILSKNLGEAAWRIARMVDGKPGLGDRFRVADAADY